MADSSYSLIFDEKRGIINILDDEGIKRVIKNNDYINEHTICEYRKNIYNDEYLLCHNYKKDYAYKLINLAEIKVLDNTNIKFRIINESTIELHNTMTKIIYRLKIGFCIKFNNPDNISESIVGIITRFGVDSSGILNKIYYREVPDLSDEYVLSPYLYHSIEPILCDPTQKTKLHDPFLDKNTIVKSNNVKITFSVGMCISILDNGIITKYKITRIDKEIYVLRWNQQIQSFDIVETIISKELYDNIKIIKQPVTIQPQILSEPILPQNIDLTIKKIPLSESASQNGGNITYLFREIGTLNDTYYITNDDSTLSYYFDDKENIKQYENIKPYVNVNYFAEGSMTIVCKINPINEKKYFALKITYNNINIDKYKENLNISQTVRDALPKILYYGKLLKDDYRESNIESKEDHIESAIESKEIGYYTICPIYKTELSKLPDNIKINISMQLINLLKNLIEYKYILTDLKSTNIGVDENNKLVIIDYELNTLINLEKNKKYDVNKQTYYIESFNTSIHPYLSIEFFTTEDGNINYKYTELLLYFFVVGLAEILYELFLSSNYNEHEIYKIISNQSKFKTVCDVFDYPITPLNNLQQKIKYILLYNKNGMKGLFANEYNELVELDTIYDMLDEIIKSGGNKKYTLLKKAYLLLKEKLITS
jgi:hypothetical protein